MPTEIFEDELRAWEARGAFTVLERATGPFGDRFTIDTGRTIIAATEDELRFMFLGLYIGDRLAVPAHYAETPSVEVMA